MKEIFEIAAAIIASSGVAGAVLFGLSSWLGKVWANRIMADEKAKHDRELATLRADLQHQNDRNISALKTEFDIYRETFLRGHSDKVVIYRQIADMVVDFLMDINIAIVNGSTITPQAIADFERRRMKVYAYLGALAPQRVMDAYDQLVDHLLFVIEGRRQYKWAEVRNLALNMINQVRSDIGIDTTPIEYKGDR
ncbi:MAG: hypothetical protein HZB61_07480 [Nitrospirae bacterium]|nr:hypothetical protein [Nitrospirota bacterium]